jgi:xanthine dehydrogenase YagT iron-sulfur-binding subunit
MPHRIEASKERGECMAQDVSRRDFLKIGGAGAAGAAAAGLGIASITGCSPASGEVIREIDFVYTCPACGRQFADHEALVEHFNETHPDMAIPELATLLINGAEYRVQIEPHWTLREALQYAVGLTGSAKEMCGRGACGSCSVLIDGQLALSCSTLAIECVGRAIETIEGIAANPDWKPLVDAYVEYDAMQCGYCTPGQLTVAKYLLTQNPEPSDEDIRLGLSGNICRCGTYERHVMAIQKAASLIKGGAA